MSVSPTASSSSSTTQPTMEMDNDAASALMALASTADSLRPVKVEEKPETSPETAAPAHHRSTLVNKQDKATSQGSRFPSKVRSPNYICQ